MVDNYSRYMTALEMTNSLRDIAIELDEIELIASIAASLLNKFFPNLELGDSYDSIDNKNMVKVTRNDMIEFFANIALRIGHADILSKLGALITYRLLVEDNKDINNKEVN